VKMFVGANDEGMRLPAVEAHITAVLRRIRHAEGSGPVSDWVKRCVSL